MYFLLFYLYTADKLNLNESFFITNDVIKMNACACDKFDD